MNGYQWKNTLIDFLEYFLKNKEYIQNLLKHTSGYDSFLRQFSLANIRHLTKCILKLSNVNKLDPDMEIYISIYCHGTGQIVCEWLLGRIFYLLPNVTLFEKAHSKHSQAHDVVRFFSQK